MEGIPCRHGKVRDIYDLGDRLVIVATDRISAFDWILPTPIPDKGRILTAMSLFWFVFLDVPNHFLTTDLAEMGTAFEQQADQLRGRTMMVRKADVVPVECVARGYLAGSGWKEYLRDGSVCGIPLPSGIQQSQALPETVFTPATKAVTGHDENISFEQMIGVTGRDLAEALRERTLAIYARARDYADGRGIIIADTKFEWGKLPNGDLILVDEVLTPDSSRFWPKNQYVVGKSPPSYDKQFVRNWLETTSWDKNSPPPELPTDIVEQSRQKYIEAYEQLTLKRFE